MDPTDIPAAQGQQTEAATQAPAEQPQLAAPQADGVQSRINELTAEKYRLQAENQAKDKAIAELMAQALQVQQRAAQVQAPQPQEPSWDVPDDVDPSVLRAAEVIAQKQAYAMRKELEALKAQSQQLQVNSRVQQLQAEILASAPPGIDPRVIMAAQQRAAQWAPTPVGQYLTARDCLQFAAGDMALQGQQTAVAGRQQLAQFNASAQPITQHSAPPPPVRSAPSVDLANFDSLPREKREQAIAELERKLENEVW
jgi:hypothetical protein